MLRPLMCRKQIPFVFRRSIRCDKKNNAMPNPRNTKKTTKKFSIYVSVDTPAAKRHCIKLKMPDLKRRLAWVLSMMCDFSTSVNVRFCSGEEMQSVNLHYRKKDYATDVLSFPRDPMLSMQLQSMEQGEANVLGDILICLPVCIQQAKKFRVSVVAELEKMLIHGLVHLKGFDHERGREAFAVMSSLETELSKMLVHAMGKPTWCLIVSGARRV